ncbi:scabin-related ADP-ribosyltransferase [Streptomyces sp. CA-250714]|uniref:scabin-related ADP-ribosyltransferase n=1 Tax=Streptomyces sp. CA-250714 TaxID=3240060 RepID=UPI003D900836
MDPLGLAPDTCRQGTAKSFGVSRRAVINPSRVFRGDARHPSEVIETGFTPKGTNTDIGEYALKDTPSDWVGTSKKAKEAANFPMSSRGRGTWVYEIHNPGYGVDINKAMGGAIKAYLTGRASPSEREVIFRQIDPSNIRRAERWEYGRPTGEVFENPGFSP